MKPIISSNRDYIVDVGTGVLKFTRTGKQRLDTFCKMVGERIGSIKTVQDLERVFSRHPAFVRNTYFKATKAGSGGGEAIAHLITGNLRGMEKSFLDRDSQSRA